MSIPANTAPEIESNQGRHARLERTSRALKPALAEEPALQTETPSLGLAWEWPDEWEEPEKEELEIARLETGADLEEQILGFYREYRPRLYRYLRSLEIPRDLADEIVQETFLRLTDQLLSKQDIQTLEGWLIRVAHNLAINACKENNREVAFLPARKSWTERADPAHNPEQAYLEKERMARMKTALESLDSRQRHCFLMRAQGFRYQDIGQALGISSQRACVLVKKAALRLGAICG
jgi:RNA polymerase sigma-70 factor (ECF subfamily)